MRHLIIAIPYVAVYFIAALLIYKYEHPSQIILTILVAASLFYLFHLCLPKISSDIDKVIKKLSSGSNDKHIEAFKLPSTVVYRVRNKYEISIHEIEKAEADIKNIFKQALVDINNGETPKITSTNKITPLSYVFWNELYKTGDLYKDFCHKTLGKFFAPPFNKVKEVESNLVALKPTLKNN